jgi:hypothetical protein
MGLHRDRFDTSPTTMTPITDQIAELFPDLMTIPTS